MMESEGGCINLVNNNNRRIRNNIYQTNKPIQSAFIRV